MKRIRKPRLVTRVVGVVEIESSSPNTFLNIRGDRVTVRITAVDQQLPSSEPPGVEIGEIAPRTVLCRRNSNFRRSYYIAEKAVHACRHQYGNKQQHATASRESVQLH